MSTKTKLMTQTLLALAGLVFFFIALQQRTINEVACVIDTLIAGAMIAPILHTLNSDLERADD